MNTSAVEKIVAPEMLFSLGTVDAVRVNEVYLAKILSPASKRRQQRKREDVRIKPTSGEARYITRKELVANFRYLDNSCITLSKLRNDKGFLVYRRELEEVEAVYIPKGYATKLGDTTIHGGVYLIRDKETGQIQTRKAKHFKKTHRVTIPEALREKFNLQRQKPKQTEIPTQKANNESKPNSSQPMAKSTIDLAAERFSCVARVMDMGGNLVGFTIHDIKKNRQHRISRQDMLKLVKIGAVKQVEAVKNNDGTGFYIRGREGLKINELPEERIG